MSNKNNAVSLRAFGYHTWEADVNRMNALDAAVKFAGYQPVYARLQEVCALQGDSNNVQLTMARDILYLESTQKSGQRNETAKAPKAVKALKALKAVKATPEYELHPQVIAFALKELAESVQQMATTISCLQASLTRQT